MNGPKDPWPRVLSLPGAQGGFVGDPTSLARGNIYFFYNKATKALFGMFSMTQLISHQSFVVTNRENDTCSQIELVMGIADCIFMRV